MSRRLSARLPVEQAYASPAKAIQIPLNDDDEERSRRYRDRNVMNELQRNRLSFGVGVGATPRKAIDEDASEEINSNQQRLHATPKTPRNVGTGRRDRRVSMMTPMRRVVVGDFEEWMKMANDNKINATNSWNFALIDYFYDMTLLKEGDGVNFQKASCTLDGCVKIYTSRVDSVATETGKLLSGLADSDSKKKRGGDGELGEDGEEGSDDDEEGATRKKRKRTQKTAESTLAKDFSSISLKKFELEFTVDPLFKKASADFDEGGAKGLLLNHLSIDSKGRIVFDSSDDANDGVVQQEAEEEVKEEDEGEEAGSKDINLGELREKFFPDLDRIDELHVCFSLKDIDLGGAGTLDIPFLKASEDKNEDEDDDGADIGGMDVGDDDYELGPPGADGTMAFGEGGDMWANETLADAAQRFMTPGRPNGVVPLEEEADEDPSGVNRPSDAQVLAVTMSGNGGGHQQILSYFDEALRKNWAGPEHWRIRKLKDSTLQSKQSTTLPKKKREKEVFEINFMDPNADVPESALLPESRTSINLSKDSKQVKSRNLLPDDTHFSSKNLIRLFLKPKAMIGSRRAVGSGIVKARVLGPNDKMDEDFWAKEAMRRERRSASPGRPADGQYDADFFNEGEMGPLAGFDEDDDDQFVDAPEEFSSQPPEIPSSSQAPDMPTSSAFNPFTSTQDFGSQLVTAGRRVRPEYVQYARVAKKVDVRRLKENLWKDLDFEKKEEVPVEEIKPKQFSEVVNHLSEVYPKQAMADISTSYCFICVLHLANEKGLIITGNENLNDLQIKKDPTADGGDEY